MSKKNTSHEKIEELKRNEECFIITPIGAFGSDVYNKAMGLIDAVIDPVLNEFEMCAMPANRMPDLGSINKQLIKRVVEDRLVIANLTGLNPNVMYELAIRHGARKPVIIMAEEGTRLPFDITDQRAIFYTDTFSGVEKAKEELRKKIVFALEDQEPDNPIYSYLENAKLFKEVKADDPLKAIMRKLDELSNAASSSNFLQRNWDEPEKAKHMFALTGIVPSSEGNGHSDDMINTLISQFIGFVRPFASKIEVLTLNVDKENVFYATISASSTLVAKNFLDFIRRRKIFEDLTLMSLD